MRQQTKTRSRKSKEKPVWDREVVEIRELKMLDDMQMRVDPRDESEYLGDIEEAGGKWPFPPLKVCRVAGRLILVDGFTRARAVLAYLHKHAGEGIESFNVPIRVREATRKEARIEAYGSNAEHGYRRTNADKRNAVVRALAEMRGASCERVAKVCKVSAPFVYKLRAKLANPDGEEPTAEEARIAAEDHDRQAQADRLEAKRLAAIREAAEAVARAGGDATTTESERAILGACPVCSSTHWTASDAGYKCAVCGQHLGEASGDSGEEEAAKLPRPTKPEKAPVNMDPRALDLRLAGLDKASLLLGQLIRALDPIGDYAPLKSELAAINSYIVREKVKCRKQKG